MNRNMILSAIATVALVTAGSSVAKPAKSGHPHGASAKAKTKGNAKAKTASRPARTRPQALRLKRRAG